MVPNVLQEVLSVTVTHFFIPIIKFDLQTLDCPLFEKHTLSSKV